MKSPELTPGAERALEFAARYVAPGAGSVDARHLLAGLLAEPECRAALLLAASGIGLDEVCTRWPELKSATSAEPANAVGHSPAVAQAPAVAETILAAELRLADHPRPVEFATEHLLLGLAAGSSDVAHWLNERGLDADRLAAEIRRRAGHAVRRSPELGPAEREAVEPEPSPDEQSHFEPSLPPKSAVALPIERMAVLRIIDAAANRASEGLRVVEDYARFGLDDRLLTERCKALRHELTAALASFPPLARHAARETQADVGASVKLASEQARSGVGQVIEASFQRAQQALRSLEEYAKTIDPAAAVRFERLRYETYTLQRVLSPAAERRARLAGARTYVLVDGRASADDFERLIAALVAAQVDVIQLRDKVLADRELVQRARQLRGLTRGSSTLFVMNDRPDLALLAHADGVHVGQDELPVKDVRSLVGAEMLIGVSTHSLEQARAAVLDGADYVGVGPTFPSRTKTFSEFPGLELLTQVAGEIALPAFAIGGISLDNVAQVRACGVTRVAVSGAVLEHADPASAVAELRKLLCD